MTGEELANLDLLSSEGPNLEAQGHPSTENNLNINGSRQALGETEETHKDPCKNYPLYDAIVVLTVSSRKKKLCKNCNTMSNH